MQMADSSVDAFPGSLGLRKLSAEVDDWINCDKGGTGILDPLADLALHVDCSGAIWHRQKQAHVEPDQYLATSSASDRAQAAWPNDRIMGAHAAGTDESPAMDHFTNRDHGSHRTGGDDQLQNSMSAHVWAETSGRQRPGRQSRKPRCAQPAHATTPFVRAITCSMSLRLFNIPRAMQAHLGLFHAYPMIGRRRSRQCTIYICSPDGFRHPVRMVAASGSHHHRLTEGWRAFCVHAGVGIGDAIRFYQTGVLGVLNTSVVRRGVQDQDAGSL